MHHTSKSIYLRQLKITVSVQRPKIYQKNIFTYKCLLCETGIQVKKSESNSPSRKESRLDLDLPPPPLDRGEVLPQKRGPECPTPDVV